MVAEEPLRGDLVPVLGPLLLDRGEPGPDLDPLDGVDPHQGGGELGVELSIDRLPEPARDPGRPHRDPRPDGVPLLAKRVHEAFELGHELRVGREEGVAVHLVEVDAGRPERPELREPPPHRAPEAFAKVLLRDRPRRDPHRGLAGRGPAAAPIVPDPVLGEVGIVRVRGPEHVADAGVVAGPRVGVLDEERDRGSGGGALEHPGEYPDLVRLAPLGGVAAPAGAAPVEVGLNVGLGKGEAGRAPVHHAPDRRAVALAERGHREMGPEGVAGHARPAPSRSLKTTCRGAAFKAASCLARGAPGNAGVSPAWTIPDMRPAARENSALPGKRPGSRPAPRSRFKATPRPPLPGKRL